jgi:hypothetical protein
MLSLLFFLFFIVLLSHNFIFAEEFACPYPNSIPFSLKYEIENGTVKSICPTTSLGLIVKFDTDSDGQITIKIPKNIQNILDSKLPNCDGGDFMVLIDGEENDYSEEKSFFARTLTIPFKDGSSHLEIIIGSYMPEDIPFLNCLQKSPKQQVMAGTSPQDIVCNMALY